MRREEFEFHPPVSPDNLAIEGFDQLSREFTFRFSLNRNYETKTMIKRAELEKFGGSSKSVTWFTQI